MTTLPSLANDREIPESTLLLHLTADAWTTVLTAVLDDQDEPARRVLRGSRGRRSIAARRHRDLQVRVGMRQFHGGDFARASNALHLVVDVTRIEELMVRLARCVVLRQTALRAGERADVELLSHAGAECLCALADAAAQTDPGRQRLAGGLREVAERLARYSHDRRPEGPDPVELCAALAAELLQASRHAARAA